MSNYLPPPVAIRWPAGLPSGSGLGWGNGAFGGGVFSATFKATNDQIAVAQVRTQPPVEDGVRVFQQFNPLPQSPVEPSGRDSSPSDVAQAVVASTSVISLHRLPAGPEDSVHNRIAFGADILVGGGAVQ